MSLGMILYYLFQLTRLYSYLMIIWVFSSWFPQAREVGIIRFIGRLVEPYLNVFRRILPNFGGMDFSPIVAFLVYDWVIRTIFSFLFRTLL